MGILEAISDSIEGSLADQWKEIYTAKLFDEHTVVSPGIPKSRNNNRGSNLSMSDGLISNGSRIFVPENTAAFVFDRGGIETIVTTPGNYIYNNGEESIFNGPDIDIDIESFFNQVANRLGYGGIPSSEKRVAFVNLREIRHIPFGTRGPQVYNDRYYNCDLEVYAYGTFSLRVIDPALFLKNFVPANVFSYSFDLPSARKQILSEFLQSFIVALNSMSSTYRISQLPSQAKELSALISRDIENAGSWPERFGFELVKVAIENIEFSPDSRELVKQFSSNRMHVKAYEDTSQRASDIAAQQKISQGIQNHGFGDGGGMLLGMNMANAIPPATPTQEMTLEEQIEAVKKLKELVDMGILSQEEFDSKKKEILRL